MSQVRVTHQLAPVVPSRSTMSLYRTVTRPQINYRAPSIPRFFPVLQAPTYETKSEYFFEDQGRQQANEMRAYPTMVNGDHSRKLTRQITVRTPTFFLQQNYPKQPLKKSATRSIRHAEPKYSSRFYSTR